MARAEQGQLRKWIDEGFPDDNKNLFFVVSITSFDKETSSRDVASIITCSDGLDEHVLKVSVDYVERNSVIIA